MGVEPFTDRTVECTTPSLADQVAFWNQWNQLHRTGDVDSFMARQQQVAIDWARKFGGNLRILEVGCGTGWLCAALSTSGNVVGIDLSPLAIESAKRLCPLATFICGDFQALQVPREFNFVVSVDAMGHVTDHKAFIAKVTSALVPGGLFVLMTQNPFVWKRSSYLSPRGHGQIRNWPTIAELRALLAADYSILELSSIVPQGDRGVLRLINSRYVFGILRRIVGRDRAIGLYERFLIGRDLVVVARKR